MRTNGLDSSLPIRQVEPVGSPVIPFTLWTDTGDPPDWVRAAAATFPVEQLLEIVVPRCVSIAFPEHLDDDEFVARLRRSVQANACALRSVIAGELRIEEVFLGEVLELAAMQAQMRVPQKAIHRSYRISFFTMLEAWTEHVADAATSQAIEPEAARRANKLVTQAVLSYHDFIASQVADTYTRDYDLLSRSHAHMRRNLVRDLLGTDEATVSAFDAAILAYELTDWHVAVLLPTVPENAATHIAARLRSSTTCRATLIYPLTLTSTVIWLGRIGPWTDERCEQIRTELEADAMVASMGEPLEGIAGFRRSLEQARSTERIRAAWGDDTPRACLRFADVALEVLLLQNPHVANSFVERELGPLAQDTQEAARLRATIEASSRLGSHVAAADYLQLHEHTVRNRLAKAESILGCPISSRSTEIQVAVRLAKLLKGLSGERLERL
jgi:hypothetical protein